MEVSRFLLFNLIGMLLVLGQGIAFPKMLLAIGNFTYLIFLLSSIAAFIFAYRYLVEFDSEVDYDTREEYFEQHCWKKPSPELYTNFEKQRIEE